MTSLLSAVDCAPSTEALPPDGLPNPQADDAVDIVSIAGLDLFDWQQDVLRKSMRRRGTRWAASEVGLVVCRQNGKGSVLEARQLAGLFVLGERLQIHSAHEFKTCYEHFRRVKDLIESTPLLMDQVKIIRTGAGDQAIELTNGCRIRFIARSRSSGRGFSADVVYLDEAFELSDETMGALLPTLSARPDPQIWYTSSAPHRNSTVLHRVRARGHDGSDPGLYFAEWACTPDDDPSDPANWAKANPSLGMLIEPDRIATAQRSLEPAEFAREHLGVPEPLEGTAGGPISVEVWQLLTDGDSLPVDGTERLSLEVSSDGSFSTFGIAGKRADNLGHVSVRHREPGSSWVVDRAKALTDGHGCPLTIVTNTRAAGFIPELEREGVPIDVMSQQEFAGACQRFVDAINAPEPLLRHRGSPDHTAAVTAAQIKLAGDGGFVLSRRSSSSDITPLTSAVIAWARVGHGATVEPSFHSLEDFLTD